ncbi:hypothetical protein, partial [Serratia fonticola]
GSNAGYKASRTKIPEDVNTPGEDETPASSAVIVIVLEVGAVRRTPGPLAGRGTLLTEITAETPLPKSRRPPLT